MSIPYPLKWPAGWPRTEKDAVSAARFSQQRCLPEACAFVLDELRRLGAEAESVVVSSNVQPLLLVRAQRSLAQPADRGVAVYFQLKGRAQVLACDRWDRVEDNLYAVGKHIVAIRAQARYGVGTVQQAFAGYLAPARPSWWEVLKVPPQADPKEIERAYQREARRLHPDRGGSDDSMARLNAARDEARQERRAS